MNLKFNVTIHFFKFFFSLSLFFFIHFISLCTWETSVTVNMGMMKWYIQTIFHILLANVIPARSIRWAKGARFSSFAKVVSPRYARHARSRQHQGQLKTKGWDRIEETDISKHHAAPAISPPHHLVLRSFSNHGW